MKKTIIAVLGIAFALWAAPMTAQHGGGGHGGGSHGGGGGSHGGGHGGGRHGGGFHGGGHGGFHGGGHGGFHGGYHGGWWGPRYGYGWGWGWTGWYYPYYPYYGGYGYPGAYAYYGGWPGYDFAVVDTDVSPDEARVFLDGRYIGTADDFDGFPDYLYLGRGHYRIEFRLEGYETKVVELEARPGMKRDIDDNLKKIPGSKQYGSYDTPEPEGGVQRFFVKKSDGSDATARPDDQYGAPQRGEDRYQEDQDGTSRPSGEVEQAPPDRGSRAPEDWRERPTATRQGTARSTRLVIRAVPADAAVYVDDRFVGTAEEMAGELQGIRVSPGRHTVTVSRPGYKDKMVEVEVDSGQTEVVEVELAH